MPAEPCCESRRARGARSAFFVSSQRTYEAVRFRLPSDCYFHQTSSTVPLLLKSPNINSGFAGPGLLIRFHCPETLPRGVQGHQERPTLPMPRSATDELHRGPKKANQSITSGFTDCIARKGFRSGAKSVSGWPGRGRRRRSSRLSYSTEYEGPPHIQAARPYQVPARAAVFPDADSEPDAAKPITRNANTIASLLVSI